MTKDGADSAIVKHFDKKALDKIIKEVEGKEGDLLLFVADKEKVVNDVLSRLRLEVGERLGMIDKNDFKFCWIVDFPLFEFNCTNDVVSF